MATADRSIAPTVLKAGQFKLGNTEEDHINSNQGGTTIPVFWGRHRVGPRFMTPIYNGRADPITRKIKTGKKKSETSTVGHNYFGTFAMVVGMGPMTRLVQIEAQEAILLIDPDFDDPNNKLQALPITSNNLETGPVLIDTEIKRVRWYWGNADQEQDAVLKGEDENTPSYAGLCYMVCDDLFFGQQNSPPNMVVTVDRVTRSLPGLSAYDNEGRVPLAEVIHDVFTNLDYGLGWSPNRLDADSFRALAESHIADDLLFAPYLKKPVDPVRFVHELMGYFDGYLSLVGGRIGIKQARATTPKLTVIGDDITKLPDRDISGTGDRWTEARVIYRDTDNTNDAVAIAFSPSAFDSGQAEHKPKIVQRPFVRDSLTANRLVQVMSRRGACRQEKWTLSLPPSFYRDESKRLLPGDVITVDYEHFQARLRIDRVTIRKPTTGSVRVTASLDDGFVWSRLNLIEDYGELSTIQQPANSFFRVAWLTSDQKGAKKDGYLVAASRPHQQIIGGDVWVDHRDTSGIAYLPEHLDETIVNYALGCRINTWRIIKGNYVAIDVTFRLDHERETFQQAVAAGDLGGLKLVTCYKSASTPVQSTQPVWSTVRAFSEPMAHEVDEGRWLIDVEMDGPDYYQEGVKEPTLVGFIGRPGSDFLIKPTDDIYFERLGHSSPNDAGNGRIVTLQTNAFVRKESLERSARVDYWRKDINMSGAGGSFYPNWQEDELVPGQASPTYSTTLGSRRGSDPYNNAPGSENSKAYRNPNSVVNEGLETVHKETATLAAPTGSGTVTPEAQIKSDDNRSPLKPR